MTEAHLVPLLIALAVIAVGLGLLAKLVAMRLLAEPGEAANDAIYDQSKIAFRSRRSAERAALKVAQPVPPGGPAAAPPYFPQLASQSSRKPHLERVSEK